MAVCQFCMLARSAALGTAPLASSWVAEMSPHFFCWMGGLAVVVWQMSRAEATSAPVTPANFCVGAQGPGATESEVAGSQSSSVPLLSTSNAPGFTSAGLGQPGPGESQQSPLQVVQPSPSASATLS